MNKLFLSAAIAFGAIAASASADNITIYTGGAPTGEGSAYHEGIGQGVADFLEPIADRLGMEIVLVPTSGAVDNAKRLAAHNGIAFGIGQGGLTYDEVTAGTTKLLRNDLPGECAVSFTAEPRIQDWGEIVANAARVTWVVPENSGSEAFIKKLYAEDENFPGTPKFKFVSGAENIIATVNNPVNRGAVGFYYAYPSGTSGLINSAAKSDMAIFGVLSPAIAKSDDSFYLNRKAPYQMAYWGFGDTKTTRAMCSKALLMASDPAKITDDWNRADAEEIYAAVAAASAAAFVPKTGPLAGLMSKVEQMSEEFGVNEMVSDLEAQVGKARK